MSENEKPVEKPSESDESSQSDEKKGLPDEELTEVSGGVAREVAVTSDPDDGGEIAGS
jgi:hypothetical protein